MGSEDNPNGVREETTKPQTIYKRGGLQKSSRRFSNVLPKRGSELTSVFFTFLSKVIWFGNE